MTKIVIDTDNPFSKENIERYIELEKLRKKAKENNLLNREGKPKDLKKWDRDDLIKFRQLSSIFETIEAYSVSSKHEVDKLKKENAELKKRNAELEQKLNEQPNASDEDNYLSPESMNHSY